MSEPFSCWLSQACALSRVKALFHKEILLKLRRFILPVLCCLAFTSFAAAQSSNPADQQRIAALIAKMTLEEKIDYIGGTGFALRPMPTLNLPSLEMSDGPYGVRSNARFPSTAYPVGIGLAASWDRKLAERIGIGIGSDARARGVHFMLGPGVNIYRSPLNGRNFEYFGEDPFLSSAIAVGYISGMQTQGVSSTVKHFLANNSEFDRHNSDSIVDERTLREIYLPAFEAAVTQAHTGAIMDSYNLINGVHATQNSYFNTEIVRNEWHFPGVMMSDWDATYDAVGAANGGLDIEMPFGKFMNKQNLLAAVKDGRVKEATIDEKLQHILQTAVRFGWLDREQRDSSLSTYNEANHQLALEAARESIVLVKNADDVLPLKKAATKSVLVVGPNAYPAQVVGGGSAGVLPFAAVSALQAISHYLGTDAKVYYERGLPTLNDLAVATDFTSEANGTERGLRLERFHNATLEGTPASTATVRHLNEAGFSWDNLGGEDIDEILASLGAPKNESSRWTGYFHAPSSGAYELAAQGPVEGGGFRIFVDNKLVLDDWSYAKVIQPHQTLQLSAGPHKVVAEDYVRGLFGGRLKLGIAEQSALVKASIKALAAKVDAVVVAVGFTPDSESEGADRTFDLPFGQQELIRQMAAVSQKTIVTVVSGGNADAKSWIDLVPAYLQLWYPGEQGGQALAEILFGEVNPSGHLPVTFEQRAEDNPSFHSYYPEGDTKPVKYTEGIFIGYRGYEHNHTQPLFPFGLGLSYTKFSYSHLSVVPAKSQTGSPTGVPKMFSIEFDVTNTGKRSGADVAQVYVAPPSGSVPRPAKELKGFARVDLQPGETTHVSLPLDARAFTYYDVAAKHWHAEAGKYAISVGRSSTELPLQADATLDAPVNVTNSASSGN